MRSAMGAKLQLYSIRLPCTRMVLVPAPCTQPPQRFRNAARSLISGSRAAPRRTVSPCAAAAAKSSVSVAPTLGNPSVMSAPYSPAGAVRISLAPSSRQCTPICARPERCRSTGLAPMRHPPGNTVSTRPSRARSGAQNKMDARIRAAASGARRQVEGTPCTVMSLPCQRAVQPAPCKSSTLVSTSARCGTCRKRTVPLHKRAAASSGNTLFLAAGMCTVPFSGMPPVMIRSPPMQKAPVPQKIPHAMRREGFLFILSAVVSFVCPVICG